VSVTIEIEIQGTEKMKQALRDPDLIVTPLRKTLSRAALYAEAQAKSPGFPWGMPKDTGALARSIRADVRPFRARVYSPLKYAAVMERGRRPGAKMPPPNRLAGWARRHGIPQSALFVLARAIARRGIKGRFFMRRAERATLRRLPVFLRRMADEIETAWDRMNR
jgi:hypothetical protein